MRFDDVLDDGQPQPQPAVRAFDGTVGLAEAIEDVWQEVLINALPRVADDEQSLTLQFFQSHFDQPLFGRELDRVAEQVQERLFEPIGIADAGADPGFDDQLQSQPLGLDRRPHRVHRRFDYRAHVYRFLWRA